MSLPITENETREDEIRMNRIQSNEIQPLSTQPTEFERHSVESGDEYSQLHSEIAALWIEADRYPVLSVEREAIRKQINELRERAYAAIPYGATLPNKLWNGRRA